MHAESTVAMLRICCFILCLVAASRQVSITELIVPPVINIGENAELQCRYSLGQTENYTLFYVKWWWTPLNHTSEHKAQIYQHVFEQAPQILHSDFIIEIKENDTIVLLNLQPKDSGLFECEVSNIDEVRTHDELIVYTEGSGPLLNMSIVEDGPDEDIEHDVLVTCQAIDVAPTPTLVIKVNDEDVQILPQNMYVSDPEDGFYNITANITLSKAVAVDAEIRCKLLYKDRNFTYGPYEAVMQYNEDTSEAEVSTTEATEGTTQGETANEPYDSADALSSSLLQLVALAGLLQLLVIH